MLVGVWLESVHLKTVVCIYKVKKYVSVILKIKIRDLFQLKNQMYHKVPLD